MSKGLEALEEIKTCKLIDHVKIKEGLFSNKLLSYERRYGKDVFSKQIPIIEKELKALEIMKNKEVQIATLILSNTCDGYNFSKGLLGKFLTQEEYNLLKEVLL